MSVDAVRRVVDQIIPILDSHGYPDKAEWLRSESAPLRDAAASGPAVRAVMQKLHRMVSGMGGLMDLGLVGTSRVEEVRARETLDRLGEELYELTR